MAGSIIDKFLADCTNRTIQHEYETSIKYAHTYYPYFKGIWIGVLVVNILFVLISLYLLYKSFKI